MYIWTLLEMKIDDLQKDQKKNQIIKPTKKKISKQEKIGGKYFHRYL